MKKPTFRSLFKATKEKKDRQKERIDTARNEVISSLLPNSVIGWGQSGPGKKVKKKKKKKELTNQTSRPRWPS